MTATLTAKTAERERCLRDIAYYERALAGSPSSDRTAMLLEAEREHLARVESFLAAAGWRQP